MPFGWLCPGPQAAFTGAPAAPGWAHIVTRRVTLVLALVAVGFGPLSGCRSPAASDSQPPVPPPPPPIRITASATGQPPAASPGNSSTGTAVSARPGASSTSPATTAPRLVSSASWVTRSGVRGLKVVPTTAGRTAGVDAEAVWQAVLRVRPDADTPGMHDQLVCHVEFASTKGAWYLEPARPDVGYAATVAAACNPGSVKDLG
ncbi:MAG: DUF2599 domain-containing protein [Actinomycetales bacterium]|nr:DUF2599 domain-containing protein [Actinomycetales bacterium]